MNGKAFPPARASWAGLCGAGLLCLLSACSQSAGTPYSPAMHDTPPAYDYPIQNAYAATIIGMPPKEGAKPETPPEPEERTITLFPDRAIPEGFWYERGLRYSRMLQSHPAPLVYLVAGTGADNRAAQIVHLGGVLYQAGFHVVLLPSPTHQNFIINASHNRIANRPEQSAADLYRVIQRVERDLDGESAVTDRMIAGYSLGALDAAFAARIDEDEHAVNFRRVLLLDPPLSVNSSLAKIDRMLYRGLPGGIDEADSFIETQVNLLSGASGRGDPLDFSVQRSLLQAYDTYKPDDETLASVVGLAFRLASANLTFASDVMSRRGYIFPKDQPFTTSSDLDQPLALALRTSLGAYFRDIYVPEAMREHPVRGRDWAASESGLQSIRRYVTGNPKFGLIANRDDIILSPGELQTMQSMFRNQKIFPNGGHLGNLTHPTVSYEIVKFMKTGAL